MRKNTKKARQDRKPPQFKLFQVFRVNKVPEDRDGRIGDRLLSWVLRDYS